MKEGERLRVQVRIVLEMFSSFTRCSRRRFC